MTTSIIFTKSSMETGNVVDFQEFSSERKALKFFNSETEGDGLVKSESVSKVAGQVVKVWHEAIPSKYGMNQNWRYELEITYRLN